MSFVVDYYRTTRDFLSRHKRKLLLSSGVAAVGVTVYAYVKLKPLYDQIKHELAMLEKMTKELNGGTGSEQALYLHRLNHNLSVGDLTLRQWMMAVRTKLGAQFNVEGIRATIKRHGASSSESNSENMEKWIQFKIQGFARTVTALYTAALLHALIKLQLSIVARYVQSETSGGSESKNDSTGIPGLNSQSSSQSQPLSSLPLLPPLGASMTEEVNRAYFALASHAQSEGLATLSSLAIAAVQTELDKWQLGAHCSFEDLQLTLSNIRASLDTACEQCSQFIDINIRTAEHTSPYRAILYPSHAQLNALVDASRHSLMAAATRANDSSVNRSILVNNAVTRVESMLAETVSIIETETFCQALKGSLDTAFSILLQSVSSAFTPPTSGAVPVSSTSTVNAAVNSAHIPFAAAMVRVIKSFDQLLPLAVEADSILLTALSNDSAIKGVCSMVFLPMDERGTNILTNGETTLSAGNAASVDSRSIESIVTQLQHSITIDTPAPSKQSSMTIEQMNDTHSSVASISQSASGHEPGLPSPRLTASTSVTVDAKV